MVAPMPWAGVPKLHGRSRGPPMQSAMRHGGPGPGREGSVTPRTMSPAAPWRGNGVSDPTRIRMAAPWP